MQTHHVHRFEHALCTVDGDEDCRDDGEVLRHIIGDRKRRQRATRHEQLFPDFHDLDELCGIGIEVDHVTGFFRGLRAGVHRNTNVRLGECRGIIGAVAGHGDETTTSLLALDERHLVFGLGFGEKIIDARFLRDCGGSKWIVTSDHHRANAHRAQPIEAFPHAALHDILEIDDPECVGGRAVAFCNDEWCAAIARDPLNQCVEIGRNHAAVLAHPAQHGVASALTNLPTIEQVHAAHARRCRERHELHSTLACAVRYIATAKRKLFLRKNHDATSFGCFVRERRKLRTISERLFFNTGHGHECGGLAIAEGDGSCLVEQKRVDVACCLDGTATHCNHVLLNEPIHARDADRRQQATNGCRNKTDEECDQHRNRHWRLSIDRKRLQRGHGQHKNDRQSRQQNCQRDLVGCLLTRRAFNQCDHAIDERFARVCRDADDEIVAEYARSASHGRTITATFSNDGGALTSDRAFVYGRNAFDNLTIAWNDITRQTEHVVVSTQRLSGHVDRGCIAIMSVEHTFGRQLTR